MPEAIWLNEWCARIKDTINTAVFQNYPRAWDENDITTSILRNLCSKHRMTLLRSAPDNPMFIVEWDAFKLKGPLESKRGDVAVLVRFHSTDPEPLEGVGYFEAKRIYNTGRFDGIESWEQLEYMQRNVAHHHLVLYDYEACDWNCYRPGAKGWGHGRIAVNCLSIPTNRATALRKRNRELYAHCTSFWEQLCLRYVQGFDLEFERYYFEEATGFINPRGGPDFLLVANVAVGDGGNPIERPAAVEMRLSNSYARLSDHGEDDRSSDHW